jgi:hypothetical protein
VITLREGLPFLSFVKGGFRRTTGGKPDFDIPTSLYDTKYNGLSVSAAIVDPLYWPISVKQRVEIALELGF